MGVQEALSLRIKERQARVGVLGLGYAGLPLAVTFAESGFPVVGYDRDASRVDRVRRGSSYVPDVEDDVLARLVGAGRLVASADPGVLTEVDVAVVCVPTPLDGDGHPDTCFIEAAATDVAVRIEPGALVVVESTSYPGTTEDIVGGVLAAHGRKPGEDVFLAFSSERMDPGNPSWPIDKIPKVVGGVDPGSLAVARLLYEQIVPVVKAVSSPAVAEMAKLVENAFREVNIALANEVAQACHRLGLDAWEVIDAAATKPFGFMPFYPGPGRGGHCIPSDPVFLDWRLRQSGFHPRLIQAARGINEGMPAYTAHRVARLLEDRGVSPEGARVLVLGVAYKRNVSDTRDAPAIPLIAELTSMGMRVSFHDPHVPSLRVNGLRLSCRDLGPALDEADCVVIATDHSAYDWDQVAARAACVLDCRGVLRGVTVPAVARL